MLALNLKFMIFPKSYDFIFDLLNITNIIFFTIDIIVNLLCHLDYLISFHFWVDIFVTLFLIFDDSNIRDGFFESDSSSNKNFAFWFLRFVEILRLLRLITLSKNFFKVTYANRKKYFHYKLLMPDFFIKKIL